MNNSSHRYREVTGSNPVEVRNFFSVFFTQLHKLRSLRRSFLHFHRIELAGYLDISQWAPVSAYLISRVGESLAYRSRSYPYKNWQTVYISSHDKQNVGSEGYGKITLLAGPTSLH